MQVMKAPHLDFHGTISHLILVSEGKCLTNGQRILNWNFLNIPDSCGVFIYLFQFISIYLKYDFYSFRCLTWVVQHLNSFIVTELTASSSINELQKASVKLKKKKNSDDT